MKNNQKNVKQVEFAAIVKIQGLVEIDAQEAGKVMGGITIVTMFGTRNDVAFLLNPAGTVLN